MEAGKSKIKVLTDSVLDEDPLSDWQMAAISLFPHMVQRGSSGVSSSPYEGTNLIMRAPPS